MKIFIIGYMASGKTTFGKELSEQLGTPFIDLDAYIEAKTGKSIPDIFNEVGEDGFRSLERDMLYKSVEEEPDAVIACGGGTPCFYDNMKFLNDNGVTVFIETSTPVLIDRLQEGSQNRPLMNGKSDEEIREKVLSQLCERLPFYMESKLKWHGDDLNSEKEISDNVKNFIDSYPSIFR